ncbi:hypothetical protein [Mesorhizobium sp. M2C.T.Ca.TU.002.02.1.1]|uniref:type II toxin-antitoxin system RelE family toxin n=1 Tax=Mesorhizobium sp. M2C.T.Ca.TU.002.02.1.1 TaxID=2496788 RepID=UPI000FCBAB93|nr:hypothetical protein [Mesorhizobium sp. M2C.T.Ca.TU.002.02.1.1]RUU54171.1 hypothetical protein EOD07_22135 [Mesorhizobium sp. M2C.T.Ca.TU.002.02.1.1]RUU69729.1 hypothetical protein EOD04_09490 [Mesorhizobium sp. M2C.T.Ca.TU.009.01.2.1]
MNHFAAPSFWDAYDKLPKSIRMKADGRFAKLRADPFHPSLHFKRVGRYWSARVDLDYRAVAVRDQDDMIWFWIGTHSEYERLLK